MNDKPLAQVIAEKKTTAFVKGYQATDSEALGILISQHFEWDGIKILETLASALEDANFHGECQEVNNMIQRIVDGKAKS